MAASPVLSEQHPFRLGTLRSEMEPILAMNLDANRAVTRQDRSLAACAAEYFALRVRPSYNRSCTTAPCLPVRLKVDHLACLIYGLIGQLLNSVL